MQEDFGIVFITFLVNSVQNFPRIANVWKDVLMGRALGRHLEMGLVYFPRHYEVVILVATLVSCDG